MNITANELIDCLTPWIDYTWDNGDTQFDYPYDNPMAHKLLNIDIHEYLESRWIRQEDAFSSNGVLLPFEYTTLYADLCRVLKSAERILDEKYPKRKITLTLHNMVHNTLSDERSGLMYPMLSYSYEGTYIRVKFHDRE